VLFSLLLEILKALRLHQDRSSLLLVAQELKDHKEQLDLKDLKDHKEQLDLKDLKDHRDYKE